MEPLKWFARGGGLQDAFRRQIGQSAELPSKQCGQQEKQDSVWSNLGVAMPQTSPSHHHKWVRFQPSKMGGL